MPPTLSHQGLPYLAAVMDWFSRRVLAFRLSIAMTVDFCLEAVEEALARYGRPEVFNIDQGSHTDSGFRTNAVDVLHLRHHGYGCLIAAIFFPPGALRRFIAQAGPL